MKKFSQSSVGAGEPPKGYTEEDEVSRLTRQIAEAYNGKPSIDMLKSIVKEAEKSKRAGTLTNEDLDAFYAQFAPLLDDGQRKMLQMVVQKLKKI